MTGSGRRVMVVVEDDEDFRHLVRLVLDADERLSLTGEAADADQALEAARSLQPDLAILDHFIAGTVMGLDLAPLLKQVAPDMKILLFTTHDLAIEVSRQPAIDGYLRKHDLRLLLPTIQSMLALENP